MAWRHAPWRSPNSETAKAICGLLRLVRAGVKRSWESYRSRPHAKREGEAGGYSLYAEGNHGACASPLSRREEEVPNRFAFGGHRSSSTGIKPARSSSAAMVYLSGQAPRGSEEVAEMLRGAHLHQLWPAGHVPRRRGNAARREIGAGGRASPLAGA